MNEEERGQLEQLQKVLREFRGLRKFPGWDRLAEFATAQIESRKNLTLEPATGVDMMVQQEFAKGEIAGIALFMRFPDIIEEDYADQIEVLLDEVRKNDGQD